MLRHILLAVAVLCAASFCDAAESTGVDSWLRGSGRDLEMRLHGTIVDAEGRPAEDAKVTATVHSRAPLRQLDVPVEGNRFELWVPVNRPLLHAVIVRAAAGDSAAGVALRVQAVRNAAREGLTLTLRPPERHVEVRVSDEGSPVVGAHVAANFREMPPANYITDGSGVAMVPVYADDEVSSLGVWTDDHRVGGSWKGSDAGVSTIECELDRTRRVTLRAVDPSGAPVAGLAVRMSVSTPAPDYDFIGSFEHSMQTTDERGEAIFAWFPDWQSFNANTTVLSESWISSGRLEWSGDVATLKVQPEPRRERIAGRVKAAGDAAAGAAVAGNSFQHPIERRSDRRLTFCDADGTFWLDALPDSKYVSFVDDGLLVSDLVAWVPFSSESGAAKPLELTAVEGQKVTAVVTAGPDARPLPGVQLNFETNLVYSFADIGLRGGGIAQRIFRARTDEAGRATASVPVGKLEINALMPSWRESREIEVVPGETPTVVIHRPYDEPQTVRGQLELSGGVEAPLDAAMIFAGAVDGKSEETIEATTSADGGFEFKTTASQFGVYAQTADRRAAGVAFGRDAAEPLRVKLLPTIDYRGRLLDQVGNPIAGRAVRASIRVQGERREDSDQVGSFSMSKIQTLTDGEGRYTLERLPVEVEIQLLTSSSSAGDDLTVLDRVYLERGEDRPEVVSRLNEASETAELPAAAPLEERFARALRDCRLGGYHLLVVRSGPSAAAAKLDRKHLSPPAQAADIARYLQLTLDERFPAGSADGTFAESQNWPEVKADEVFLAAYDASGEELTRETFDAASKDADERCERFIAKNAPPQVDALKKWDEAFAEAAETGQRVWAVEGGRYCGPCFLLSRWIDEHRAVLERDYVFFKVDALLDASGKEIAMRIRQSGSGVPVHAIFDANQEMLADSQGPLGNIGMPSSFEGRRHLRRMLEATRRTLTDAELDAVVASLPN